MDKLKPCPMEAREAVTVESALAYMEKMRSICDTDDGPVPQVYDMAIAALRRATPESKPLTLEELRKMQGQPVYVIEGDKQGYAIVNWEGASSLKHMYFSRTGTAEGMTAEPVFESGYGNKWLAYARKPEGSGSP